MAELVILRMKDGYTPPKLHLITQTSFWDRPGQAFHRRTRAETRRNRLQQVFERKEELFHPKPIRQRRFEFEMKP